MTTNAGSSAKGEVENEVTAPALALAIALAPVAVVQKAKEGSSIV